MIGDSEGDETVVATVVDVSRQPDTARRPKAPKTKTSSSYANRPSGGQKKNLMQWLIIAVVMVLCCVIGAIVYQVLVKTAEDVMVAKDPQTSTAQALELLSSTDLTLARIQEVERDLKHDGNADDEKKLKERINALRHLYLEGLHSSQHTVKGLMSIYVIHSGEFSEQQRKLMIWFFDQPSDVQARWERVTVNPRSLDEFRQMIEQ